MKKTNSELKINENMMLWRQMWVVERNDWVLMLILSAIAILSQMSQPDVLTYLKSINEPFTKTCITSVFSSISKETAALLYPLRPISYSSFSILVTLNQFVYL